MSYWHSKSMTKPKLELVTHIVQKIEILSGCAFDTKNKPLSIIFQMGMGTTVPVQKRVPVHS